MIDGPRRCTCLLIAAVALLAGPPPATAATVEVTQMNLAFVPADITVAPGDTIRWIRTGGNHTVTSGTDCIADGLYFDEPLNAANPIVEWVVPGDAPELISYFCQPHCVFEMTGTITVTQSQPCPADLNGDDEVGFSDLLSLLALWGPCPGCAADIDGNDAVDFNDLLVLLATWGPCP